MGPPEDAHAVLHPPLCTSGLTRRYGSQVAVDQVSFEVEGPSITGLLGRNGAGKPNLGN
jgi:ABC-2 type transport system ATP-binding protein